MIGKLVVLTGLDGSGTSSIAEELHRLDLTSTLFNSIGYPYTICRSEIDKTVRNESPSAHYLFYLSAVAHSSHLITEKLAGGNVYCVRYLIDTVVSHRVAGLKVELVYETDLYRIRKPDLTIFLEVDEGLRQERITKRGKGYLDQKLDDEEFRSKFLTEFRRQSDCFITVKVLNKSIAQITEEIRQIVGIKIYTKGD